ncbi:MAG: SOS response-associated peptidase [Rhodospirillales bacterium]|nr:SOS response-associated peptidase [Rhodospirillales bacterium]
MIALTNGRRTPPTRHVIIPSMCSRFELNVTAARLAARFDLRAATPNLPLGEIRPTNPALVILPNGHTRLLRWGLVVPWSKQPVINARMESVATKPTFQKLLARRCLIPATTWFEWRKDGRRKLKTRLRPAEHDLFALAGLAEDEHFVMLTRPALPSLARIHDRMPALLAPDQEQAWLAGGESGAEGLAAFSGPVKAVEEGTPQPDLFG